MYVLFSIVINTLHIHLTVVCLNISIWNLYNKVAFCILDFSEFIFEDANQQQSQYSYVDNAPNK